MLTPTIPTSCPPLHPPHSYPPQKHHLHQPETPLSALPSAPTSKQEPNVADVIVLAIFPSHTFVLRRQQGPCRNGLCNRHCGQWRAKAAANSLHDIHRHRPRWMAWGGWLPRQTDPWAIKRCKEILRWRAGGRRKHPRCLKCWEPSRSLFERVAIPLQ